MMFTFIYVLLAFILWGFTHVSLTGENKVKSKRKNKDWTRWKGLGETFSNISNELVQIRRYSRSEKEVTLAKEILGTLQELEVYREGYPEESEVKFFKYQEAFKIMEDMLEKMSKADKKESTLKEIKETIEYIKGNMIGEGLDEKVSMEMRKELNLLKEIENKNKGVRKER